MLTHNLHMPLQEFTALLILATAMSFTPGPNTTLSTTLAANHGLRHALPFVCAVPLGWGLLLLSCTLGLGPLVQAMPTLRWGIMLVGSACLLWLAFRLWQTEGLTQVGEHEPGIGFVQGVVLQFVNIKAWMLALTITGGWIVGKPDLALRLGIVLPTMMCYAFCSNLVYATLGVILKAWLAVGRRLTAFNRLMATTLGLTALWLWTG